LPKCCPLESLKRVAEFPPSSSLSFSQLNLSDVAKRELATSLNADRPHLSPEEREHLGAEQRERVKEARRAGKTTRQIVEDKGVD
jgi:hypothetical protein